MPEKRIRIIASTVLFFMALLGTPQQWVSAQPMAIPPREEEALAWLDSSPRWEEWARIRDGKEVLNAWMVFPERSDKAPVVIVLHEESGLTDWICAVADQLAAEGFIAIVPDLLSGKAPGGYGSFAVDTETAASLVSAINMEEVNRRLDAVVQHAGSLKQRAVRSGIKPQNQVVPAPSGKIGVVGFGWGGSVAFQYAAVQSSLSAAVVCYGASPSSTVLANLQAPVLGLYAGNDTPVNATIPDAEAEMRRLGKHYEKEIYQGADHGFLREQSGGGAANERASQQTWNRTIQFLKQYLER